MLIALAVLYVALRRARILPSRGYVGILDGLGVQIVPSRYVRPGDMLLIRRGAAVVEGPITLGIDLGRDEADTAIVFATRLQAEVRFAQPIDPASFVRITGV